MAGVLNASRPVALFAAVGMGLVLAACGPAAQPAKQAATSASPAASASPATATAAASPAGGAAGLGSNPLFTVIREVRLPGPATGALYAGGALYTWSNAGGQASNAVVRVDPATGRVTATARLAAAGAAFAGHLLWLATYPDSGSGTVPDAVVALNPATLAVVHRLKIPARPAYVNGAGGSIAAAGGLVWVSGAGTVYGIDPSTGAIVRRVPVPSPPPVNGHPFGPGGYQITMAAPPDGSALWTAETPGAGGHDGLQVRDPRSGAVIDSSTHSAGGVGETQIAAAHGYAWLAVPTGNSGGYLKIDLQPGLPAAAEPHGGGSNALSVALAAGVLWVYDPQTRRIECADPATGAIRADGHLPADAITPLPDGQIAVISQPPTSTATVAIARPKPACTP